MNEDPQNPQDQEEPHDATRPPYSVQGLKSHNARRTVLIYVGPDVCLEVKLYFLEGDREHIFGFGCIVVDAHFLLIPMTFQV